MTTHEQIFRALCAWLAVEGNPLPLFALGDDAKVEERMFHSLSGKSDTSVSVKPPCNQSVAFSVVVGENIEQTEPQGSNPC